MGRDAFKVLFLRVIAAQTLHGDHPNMTATITEQCAGIGVVERRVGGCRFMVANKAVDDVQLIDTIVVGAYP